LVRLPFIGYWTRRFDANIFFVAARWVDPAFGFAVGWVSDLKVSESSLLSGIAELFLFDGVRSK